MKRNNPSELKITEGSVRDLFAASRKLRIRSDSRIRIITQIGAPVTIIIDCNA